MALKNFGLVAVVFAVIVLLLKNVSTITFAQPVEIGSIGHYFQSPFQGIPISGESDNSGNLYDEKRKPDESTVKTYDVGVARFGDTSNALYCSYDCYNKNEDSLKFGGKDNYVLSTYAGFKKIYRIVSDADLILYVLDEVRFGHTYIIGIQNAGKFVSYVDTRSLTEQYFNNKLAYKGWEGVMYGDVQVKDNMLILPYHYQLDGHDIVEEGEFRFRWDDNAQRFNVEHIVY